MSGEEPVVNINTPSPLDTLCIVLCFSLLCTSRETWQEQPSLCVVVVRPPWHNLTQARRSAGRRKRADADMTPYQTLIGRIDK